MQRRVSILVLLLSTVTLSRCDSRVEERGRDETDEGDAPTLRVAGLDTEQPFHARREVAREAFERFRNELGVPNTPSHYMSVEPHAMAIHLYEDSRAMPRGVWAFAEFGLGFCETDCRDFVEAFIREQSGLWGLTAADIAKIELVLRSDEANLSPGGRLVRTLEFDQEIEGRRVIDGGIQAVFWDQVLTSVSGMLALPTELPRQVRFLNEDELEQAVHDNLRIDGFGEYDILRRSTAVHSDLGVVMIFHVVGRTAVDVIVDSANGNILGTWSYDHGYTAVSGSYKVYKPNSGDSDTSQANEVTVSGYGSVSGLDYYPWVDVLANRSPVPTYDGSGTWTSGGKLYWPDYGSSAYTVSAGTPEFAIQHASYWAQKAIHTADINFTWWPPSDSSYTHKSITVIANAPSCNGGGSAFDWGACFNLDLFRSADETGCMCLVSQPAAPYDGDASLVSTIFHESGHAVDWKYRAATGRTGKVGTYCDPGTSEEGTSLGEAIGTLYTMMMYLQEYGTSAGFTNYDAISNAFVGLGTSFAEAVVHNDDDDLVCHAPHNTCGGVNPCKTWRPNNSPAGLPTECSTSPPNYAVYRYAAPLLQAFWESAHGVNCDGPSPCYTMGDGAGVDESRWALFYAMKHTGYNQTYWDFVANFLTYYYYDVDETAWNNRWWVFNHHRLVGDDLGYSPCHVY